MENKEKGNMIEELRNLYDKGKNKHFFKLLAGQEGSHKTTHVDRIQSALRGLSDFTRKDIVSIFKDLESIGCGEFISGRSSMGSRFIWSTPMLSAAKVACRMESDIKDRKHVDEPCGMHVVEFNLRPDLTIRLHLPRDLTDMEALRLGTFLRSLPF